jgi:hypothetical protein
LSLLRASIGELSILMAQAPQELDAHVFFYFPTHESSAWARTDLWESARSIPGVQVIEDLGEAFAFEAIGKSAWRRAWRRLRRAA